MVSTPVTGLTPPLTSITLSHPAKEPLVPRDWVILKILTCIPALGIFVQAACEWKLSHINIEEPSYKIKVLRVQNHYHLCGMARNVLSIALWITQLAMGILAGGLVAGLPLMLMLVSLAARDLYLLLKNDREIKATEETAKSLVSASQ
jgi:hypothetical protein